jgi:iron-sulfur cluster repair protein YtfE (RIC family)
MGVLSDTEQYIAGPSSAGAAASGTLRSDPSREGAMRPSEVRRRVLDDHEAIRAMLAEVDELARRLLAGEDELAAPLRARGMALQARLLQHLELEEANLVPALREADAWGEERVARLLAEHAEQRAELARLLADLRDRARPARELARELRRVAKDLLVDMDHEEATALGADVLHDDPLVESEPE